MRLKIRWKLILGIGLPVVGVYALILGLDYRALREAAVEQTEREAARVADLYAAYLDGGAERIAQVARDGAEYVRNRPGMTDAEIDALLAGNVGQNPEIFGSCLAFEPGAYDGARDRFAPYVYRSGEGLARKDIASSYDYTLERWEWYSRPRSTMAAAWSEPHFDEGGGDIVMCTYSVPVVRDGKLLAVMTVDVDVKRLQSIVNSSELQGGVFVILSHRGRYISHPDPTMVMKKTVQETLADAGRTDLEPVLAKMLAGERGASTFRSMLRPDRTDITFYSPIPSAGWCFVAVNDLGAAMSRVMGRLAERGAAMACGLVAVFAVIFVVGSLITRPVKPLMAGVRALAAGNLDATVEGVHRRDELGELADTFNTMTARLREHVHALGEARAAREAVESELRVAKDIQAALLPRVFPGPPTHGDFALAAVCRPARAVGGDFYDFQITGGGEVFFIIADVSGKGVPAALYMAVARTLFRELARAGHGPGEILTLANTILSSENESNGMFLTAFVGAYRPDGGLFRYACAGHPPPLRVSGGEPARELAQTPDTVVGVVPDIAYAEQTDALRVGERIVLFTDGVTEARGPGGEFFGDARTAALAGATASLAAGAACDECVKILDDFQGTDQADDITMMILERRA